MAQLDRQRAKSHAIPEITEWRRAYTPVPDFDAAATLAIPALPALPKAAELKDFWGEVRGAFGKTTFLAPLLGSLTLGLGLMWWAAAGEKSFDRLFGMSWCRYFTAHPEARAKWAAKYPRSPDRVVASVGAGCNCGE